MSDVKNKKVVLILGGALAASDQQRQRISHQKGRRSRSPTSTKRRPRIGCKGAIRNTGGESRVYPVDVTQKEQVRATVAERSLRIFFGSLDTLIRQLRRDGSCLVPPADRDQHGGMGDHCRLKY